MSFYPKLLLEDEKNLNITKRLYNKGAGNVFLLKELEKKFSIKYHFINGRRILNRIKVSTDELVEDVKTVINDYNLNIDINSIKILPPGKAAGGISDKYPTLCFNLDGELFKVKFSGALPGEKLTQTLAAFKEGMVVYFFNTLESYAAFSKKSPSQKETKYFELVEKIKKDIEINDIKGLEIKNVTQILDALEGESNNFNISFLNDIFNAMSIANKLKESLYSSWEIHKDSFFSDLKFRAAKDLKFLKSDKWNPMDIILIKPESKQKILKIWADAKNEDNLEQKAHIYNSTFVNNLDIIDKNRSILGISLKETQARGGKGKSYLDSINSTKQHYNITVEERKWDKLKLLDKIIEIRNEIPSLLEKNNISDTFIYAVEKPLDGFNKTDLALGKYAALKMLKYLIEQTTLENNIFINIAAYSLSLGKNPTFFKYVGKASGNPDDVKIIKYEENGGLTLYDIRTGDSENNTGKIIIKDSNNNKGIYINYDVIIGDKINSVKLVIRTAGSVQVFIEIEKIEEIKESMKNNLQTFYPRLDEKFTDESDPVHDMSIGAIKLIKDWLDKMGIIRYTINNDLTIDVNATVNLCNRLGDAEKLPDYIQFGKIKNGHFSLYNNNLTSLKGCPYEIDKGNTAYNGDFCCVNNRLTSLEFAPKSITGAFICTQNAKRFTEKEVRAVCKNIGGQNTFMKLVREHINEKFTKESDPIQDMGIGLMHKITEWFKKTNNGKEFTENYKFLNATSYYALLCLLIQRKQYKYANLLIKIKKESLNFREANSLALRWASAQGNIKLIKILIDCGENPNDEFSYLHENDAHNSLDCAIVCNKETAANYLINIGTKFNEMTIKRAADSNLYSIEQILKKLKEKGIQLQEKLNEKFTDESDPIHDIGIGNSFYTLSIGSVIQSKRKGIAVTKNHSGRFTSWNTGLRIKPEHFLIIGRVHDYDNGYIGITAYKAYDFDVKIIREKLKQDNYSWLGVRYNMIVSKKMFDNRFTIIQKGF